MVVLKVIKAKKNVVALIENMLKSNSEIFINSCNDACGCTGNSNDCCA